MAVLYAKLQGKATEAEAHALPTTLTDVADAWYTPWVSYVAEQGWMVGSDNMFRPMDNVTAKEVKVLLLKALGYEVVWETVDADAETNGIVLTAADETLPLGSEVFASVRAILDMTPVDGTETLGTVLTFTDYVAPVVEPEVPETLEVVSVTALNLREVEVVFNREVDATEAAKVANYKIDTNNPEKATVAEDGMTVVLRMSNANALGNYSNTSDLVIESEVGFDADTTISNFAVKDVTVPEIVSVEVTGPRNLKVTFTEPLDETVTAGNTVASFKMDAGAMALDSTVGSYSGRVVTLKTLANLSEGEHTLELVSGNNIVDNAAFGAVPSTATFTYTPDTSDLTVEIASSTEKTVDLKFNKAIDPATIVGNANVEVTHTYNTATNLVTGAAITNSGDDQTFTVTFVNPLPPGATTVYVKYNSASGTLVADNYANKLAATNLIVETVADLTAPVAELAEFINATTVRVTFSEAVTSATVTDETNYTLKDAAGDAVTVSSVAFHGTSTKVVNLTTGTINGGAYTLLVEDAKDISVAANEMVDTTLAFTATDAVAPTVVDNDSVTGGIQVQKIAADKVKVTFSEAMDSAYVTDKANWQYDGAALLTADTITMDGTKSVIIKIAANVDDTKAITLARVKDVAGNWIEAFSTPLDIEALVNIAPTSIKLTAKDTIELYFKNNVISGAVAADFEISHNTGGSYAAVTVTGVATTVADGHTTIVVTADTDWTDTEVSGAILVRSVSAANTAGATAGAKNAYSTSVEFAAATPVDYLMPEIATATTNDADADGQIDEVVVVFTEAMYHPSIQDADFTVAGYTVTGIAYTNATTITLSLKELTTPDTGATPKVTLAGAVQDATAQKNERASQAAVTSVDGATPIALTAVEDSTTQVTITFSEKIDVATVAAGDFTGTSTPSAAVLAADGMSVVVTVGAMSGVETVIVNTVDDMVGNTIGATTFTRGTDF
jgi:hypothetical protein